MRFLPRVRVRRAGPPAASAASLATVHIHCGRRAETKVRALCVLALTKPSAHLLGLHVNRHDAATACLRLAVALDGPGTMLLDQLVDQLSREPSVRDLHWHQHREPDTRTRKPQPTRRPFHTHGYGS
ncbi:hypothetical protein [Streptomyces sp. HUAS TT7]|uniref:hypothetical protein n=1 Tax=Streptomyces sp. HUAS TT7 TaxID=3447507 RepID=UPI003F65590E